MARERQRSECRVLWKWAWSRGVRVAGLSLDRVGLWEGVGLRPWAARGLGVQRAVTQRGSGAARGPRTEGARYARLPGAELSDPQENGSVLNGSKPERIQTGTSAVLAPTPSFPGLTLEVSTAVTRRLSREPADYRTKSTKLQPGLAGLQIWSAVQLVMGEAPDEVRAWNFDYCIKLGISTRMKCSCEHLKR